MVGIGPFFERIIMQPGNFFVRILPITDIDLDRRVFPMQIPLAYVLVSC